MYSFSTLFPFIGNRDKLWLSEEIFTIFVILGRMVYCHGKCLVRVLLGGGFRSGVECFSVHMRSMQIWDLQSARKRLGAIFLSERVLGQLFLRVLELRVLKKIKLMHGQVVITWRHSENVSNCENGKNLIFQSNVEASTYFISACCEDFFFHRETCAAKDDFMWCDLFFFIFAVDLIVCASWDIPSFCILWIVCFRLKGFMCSVYKKVEFVMSFVR